jgi:hypothetical protein
MINSVRQTVQALLNKHNYGYLSPGDFNLFARKAQMDLFTEYFSFLNRAINAENQRMSGTEYADISKQLKEAIEIFSVPNYTLTYAVDNIYTLPNNVYLLNSVRYVPDPGTVGVWYTSDYNREVEKVSNSNITALNSSNLTAPSAEFPAYTLSGNSLYLYPSSIAGSNKLKAEYIRFPVNPKWTYASLSGGEPIFNPSAGDYQDFELPLDDEPKLVVRILNMAGLSIREPEVIAATTAQQQTNQ